jgi:glutamyl-tRNA synthetase
MSLQKTFRTRQAPSPTGYLHLGFIRQLLFTRLFADINHGIYYLRLEDTDRNRLIPEAAVALVKNLGIFGLEPDEGLNLSDKGQKDDFYGVYQSGNFGPYIQSERLSIYHEHAQNLIDKKLAYWSYLSEQDRQELQEIKKVTKHPINYFKINSEKFGEAELYKSISEGLNDPRKPVLNYRLQRQSKIKCNDLLVGETEFDLSIEEDFGILKSDGFPTYHLAHLVDDYLMETSLVLRAQEWYPSIAKHTAMYNDYWGSVPFDYLHAPFILGETGNKKMSKRDGNVNIQYYLDQGYLPEAIINYIAFLGWNPGTEKELYLEKADFENITDPQKRVQKLIQNLSVDFSLEKLSKSPARFNLEKLNWFNRQYISMMSLEEFALRSFELKLSKTYPEKNIRIGDYVYLVDTTAQETFGMLADVDVDSPIFHMIGGGREAGLDSITNLQKEVSEETENKLRLDTSRLISITRFTKLMEYYRPDENTHYNGKEFEIYFYPLNKNEITDYDYHYDDGNSHAHGWISLSKVIESNEYLTYPIWKSFCIKNNIPLFEPTESIKSQYLGWLLDKNRITVLSEFGTESECVLNWQKPEQNDLKWKKISLEDSLNNLKEILPIVLQITEKFTTEKQDLKSSIFKTDLDTKFSSLVENIEKEFKTWLSENQKDTGSYLWPLRVALSGKLKSPSPFELITVLDKLEIEKRIRDCI